ncbi:hypothetical protein A5645_19630 [Mycobacterium asiaticum]|uniref:type VII secretion target n=1 Tax=Mycobacterium asiaticum TaxID=1790 RepID=UPI0007EF8FD9|nr:type VII secretion target [Mycobacterium asiaticum]OBK93165.1 hypothetical protein A5645_19630 [Mycobacterium asiaticum]
MRLDNAAVRSIADQFSAASELIDDAARIHLAQLTFGGARAGRSYAAGGDGVWAGLAGLAGDLARWSRAAAEIAAALRASAERYADAELYAAGRIA